ncbi:24876_t:CDS:2 [Cetraspora pellucida]|uniref:24876_t:CDS:1 n=1 Tax=Cetraspora pellucida TaxID=1433469 RepID=A0A9N9FCG2_9GLOM|nr:24876_t:CDS:2 [Cetraspora pellucida]
MEDLCCNEARWKLERRINNKNNKDHMLLWVGIRVAQQITTTLANLNIGRGIEDLVRELWFQVYCDRNETSSILLEICAFSYFH